MFHIFVFVYIVSYILPLSCGVTEFVNTLNGSECTLYPTDPEASEILRKALDVGENYILIQLSKANRTSWKSGDGDLFDPLTWIRVKDNKGHGLLWLREEFTILSLNTLTYGVSALHIEVNESKTGCFNNQTLLSKQVQNLLFNDFSDSASKVSKWKPNEELCNKRMRDKGGKADFYYVCCHKDENGRTVCAELSPDLWINILLSCIVFLSVVVIMYAPLLVPSHLYRASRGFISYQHKFRSEFRMRLMKTKHRPKTDNVVHVSDIKKYPNLSKLVKDLEEDTPYEIPLNVMHFLVPRGRLIPANYVPVGIGTTLYDSILRCKLSKRDSLKKCCKSRIFSSVCSCSWNLSWYKFLQRLMDLFLLVVVMSPWLVRMTIYFIFEQKIHVLQQEAAISRGLVLNYRGSITLTLSPIHVFFLFCYGVILFDSMFIGLLNESVKEHVIFVFKKCLRDMHERSATRGMGWCIMVMLKPLEKLGLLGLLVLPVYWLVMSPFVVCVLCFYIFPTVNLTFRSMIHLAINLLPSRSKSASRNAKEHSSLIFGHIATFLELDFLTRKENFEYSTRKNLRTRSIQIMVLMVGLISMYCAIFLLIECITFFVEILVYTLIGIILNAKYTMQFVSLIFMLFLYGKDCFGSVTEKYLIFNKVMIDTVMSKTKEDVNAVALQCEDQQENTAFQLKSFLPQNDFLEANADELSMNKETTVNNVDLPSIVVKENNLKWSIKRLVLFLDKKDTPYITQKFFFATSRMPCCGSPGPLLGNLGKAIAHFMVIIVFLLFVMLVVITFGGMYDVSSSNQTLATLAGGFLPWVFRNILFKKAADQTVDVENLHFQGCFVNVIEKYQQTWPFADISDREVDGIETDGADSGSLLQSEPRGSSIARFRARELTNDIITQDFDLIVDMSTRRKYFETV